MDQADVQASGAAGTPSSLQIKPKNEELSAAMEAAQRATSARQKGVEKVQAARWRDELEKAGDAAPFCRVALWMFHLSLTRRQEILLGRIYSLQCVGHGYCMSLATGARELGMTNRAELQKDLKQLLKLGYVTKETLAPRTPPTYHCDVAVCVAEARRNGYEG